MTLKFNLKYIKTSILTYNIQLPLFFFIILLIIYPIFSYQNYSTSKPRIEYDIHVDKKIYSVLDEVIIDGYLQLNYFYSDVIIHICIFDWSDGSTLLLVKSKKDFKAMLPIYINEFNNGKSLKWICNKTGEYGIYVYLEKENDPNILKISFINEHFLVTDTGIFIGLYTNNINYLRSEIVNVHCIILSNKYYKNTNVKISLKENSQKINTIYNKSHNISIQKEININTYLNSTTLNGIYEVIIELATENLKLIKFTKFNVINQILLDNLSNKIIEKYTWIKQDPIFLQILTESQFLQFNYSNFDNPLINYILSGYQNLTDTDKTALFLFPSFKDSYITTGDLMYWFFTDFLDKTNLDISDTKILFSYLSVYNDIFRRDLQNNRYWKIYAWDDTQDKILSWYKEYIINQCNFFGKDMLRNIVNKYGIIGLIHVIYPNFGEKFGDLKFNLIPLDAYKIVREYSENTSINGLKIKTIFKERSPVEAMDIIQNMLWSQIYTSSINFLLIETNPTTKGFYEHEVINMIGNLPFSNSCVTVSRLVAIIGRSLGIPIGIIDVSGSFGHWGNFQIFEGKIILDSQLKILFEKDEFSNIDFTMHWPSLYHYNEYKFNINNQFKEEYFEKFQTYELSMNVEILLNIISDQFENMKK
jgi:hypothetical protein